MIKNNSLFFLSFLTVLLFGAGTAPAQSDDCGQGDDTNNFESGYNIVSTSVYSAADDFLCHRVIRLT